MFSEVEVVAIASYENRSDMAEIMFTGEDA